MKLDTLLGFIKVNGRPMSLHRLTWWTVIILTRLFGRQVEVEGNGGKTMKLLPIAWNGKVHLLGAEHDYLQLDFTSQYTVRVRRSPDYAVTSGHRLPPEKVEGGRIIHVILSHKPARETENLLRHAQELEPKYIVMLAYGGTRGHFDDIVWPHKIFLDDPSLHGPIYLMSYRVLSVQFRQYVRQAGIKPEWVFIGDYDAIPLKPDYLREPIALMVKHGASLGGKQARAITQSNQLFLTQYQHNAGITDALNDDKWQPFYHSLGCVLVFSGECLENLYLGKDEILGLANYELGAMTSAKNQGFRLLGFDLLCEHFKHVRYRPVYSLEEALQVAAEGAAFVHPVKETDQFLAAFKARQAVAKR
jgi:hypothetical protein